MRQSRGIRGAACAMLLAACPVAATAHDIWLHADDFTLAAGDTLVVRQLVGEELDTDIAASDETIELPVLRDMTSRFELITAWGTIDLMAELPSPRERPEVKPVLERELTSGGQLLVAMDHAVLYTGHTDREFRDYLEHESLDPAAYVPHMGTDGFQDEGYVRTLKALVRVGSGAEGAGTLHDRPIGQSIEILLASDPYTLDPGAALGVRVLLHGEALAGVTIKALNASRDGVVATRSARTDAEGRASFTLDRAGLWLLRLVHLAPCSEASEVDCSDTEWESYWSAYSFELD